MPTLSAPDGCRDQAPSARHRYPTFVQKLEAVGLHRPRSERDAASDTERLTDAIHQGRLRCLRLPRPARPLRASGLSADRTEQRAIVVGLARMWKHCPERADAIQHALVAANHLVSTSRDRLAAPDRQVLGLLSVYFGLSGEGVARVAADLRQRLGPLQHFLRDLSRFSELRLVLLPTQREAWAMLPAQRVVSVGADFFSRTEQDQTLDLLRFAATTAAEANELFDCRGVPIASGERLRQKRRSTVDFLGSIELSNVVAGSSEIERATIRIKPELATAVGVDGPVQAVMALKRSSVVRTHVLLKNADSLAQLVHCLAAPAAAQRAAVWAKRRAAVRRTLLPFAIKVISREVGRSLHRGEIARVRAGVSAGSSLWDMARELVRAPALLQPNNASVNSVAENGCRSSTDSPTPMK